MGDHMFCNHMFCITCRGFVGHHMFCNHMLCGLSHADDLEKVYSGLIVYYLLAHTLVILTTGFFLAMRFLHN